MRKYIQHVLTPFAFALLGFLMGFAFCTGKVLTPVVQKLDDTIIYPVDNAMLVSLVLICGMVFYPVNSAVQCLNY